MASSFVSIGQRSAAVSAILSRSDNPVSLTYRFPFRLHPYKRALCLIKKERELQLLLLEKIVGFAQFWSTIKIENRNPTLFFRFRWSKKGEPNQRRANDSNSAHRNSLFMAKGICRRKLPTPTGTGFPNWGLVAQGEKEIAGNVSLFWFPPLALLLLLLLLFLLPLFTK